ncbi:MAG: 50S ribosomal protein L15 [Elusimicrobia bacterium]|nr:50S ribosomal protein L15 [Elusimicrobiota bacterium]
MVRLNELKPAPGSRHRRKIVGRGEGSGHGGKGSTRGFKGQTARSGDKSMRPGFEGGQIPLIRRIPKRGFNNTAFRKEYSLVNVGDLEALFEPGAAITPEALRASRLVRKKLPVKILGDGDIQKSFQISAHAFSESAKKKIEKAGGSATVLK